jgi:uncharacterized repeat protein (TIGR01451 family)
MPIADLGVTQKDSSDPARAGGSVTYNIVVTNNGPAAAQGVTVTSVMAGDALPISASAGCTIETGSRIVCSLGALAAGANRSVGVTFGPRTRRTTLTNTVTVSGPVNDKNSANNSATELTSVR